MLWAYRTTPRSSIGETPFHLTYGSEVVLPLEVGTPSHRVANYNDQANSPGLRENLDLIDEVREAARVKLVEYQRRMARYYNSQVRPRVFFPRDLVLRKAKASRPVEASGKLAPNWEGPYKVESSLGHGAYRLKTLSGNSLPRTWNAETLRYYAY